MGRNRYHAARLSFAGRLAEKGAYEPKRHPDLRAVSLALRWDHRPDATAPRPHRQLRLAAHQRATGFERLRIRTRVGQRRCRPMPRPGRRARGRWDRLRLYGHKSRRPDLPAAQRPASRSWAGRLRGASRAPGRPGLALVVLSVVEQRLDAVRAVLAGADVTEIARLAGVHRATVHRWWVVSGRCGGSVALAGFLSAPGAFRGRGSGRGDGKRQPARVDHARMTELDHRRSANRD